MPDPVPQPLDLVAVGPGPGALLEAALPDWLGRAIDTSGADFLSFLTPSCTGQLAMEERGVGGAEGIERLTAVDGVHVFPLRRSKFERPQLPADTLRRDRLLDWLEAKIHHRAIFVVAEAGFGKTTLLADFARRSRRRTVWYRLDEDDTDGLTFLRYLVAACQAADRGLAARSASLLAEGSRAAASWDNVLDALVDDLADVASKPPLIVFDDYHLAEDIGPIRQIVERLLARAPDRLAFVFASRRTPSLSVARLRARDELAELGHDDLRFGPDETERLFRETYRQPLEPDVLADLQSRTEGWAASLQLVKAAVGERSQDQVRSFVRSLSGAEGELYEYLAEEVIGELPERLQRFLMHAALLDEIEPDVAAAAAAIPLTEARRLVTAAGRCGLISRSRRRASPSRLHPLVRQFLLARLEAEVGQEGVLELHRSIARLFEPRSWRLAARHWAAADESAEVRRVLIAATPTILGTGDYAAAGDFIARFPDPDPNPWFDMLQSRLLVDMGRYEEAKVFAAEAMTLAFEADSDWRGARDLAALTALHAAWISGDEPAVQRFLETLVAAEPEGEIAKIAVAMQLMRDAADLGDLDECRAAVLAVQEASSRLGHRRNEGIALANLSHLDLARDEAEIALISAREAERVLVQAGSADEVAAARMHIATALARLGRWDEAQLNIRRALEQDVAWVDPEITVEAAELHAMYSDLSEADRLFASLPPMGRHQRWGVRLQVETRLRILHRDYDAALAVVRSVQDTYPLITAFVSTLRVLELQIAVLSHRPDATALAEEALGRAWKQHAWHLWKTARVAAATRGTDAELNALVNSLPSEDRVFLSLDAELVVLRLGDLQPPGISIVLAEAQARPQRWRRPLRNVLSAPETGGRYAAASILDAIGEAEDIPELRAFAARWPANHHGRNLGRNLIRRLAEPVHVDDLGLMSIHVGSRVTPGTEIRRRVLSLLCFLLTRPQLAATRDQVLDAIWPEQDPSTAANSLNQTTYFLRRVFEPTYVEANSAGYLRHENEMLWLDRELVDSRSAACRRLLLAMGEEPGPRSVLDLSELYTGRFALDFTYDDWAREYRESLHAAYLQVIERAVARDMIVGEFDRAILIARRAIAVDPDAEQIEVSLLRLYKLVGAHSAAAEQYSHYASVMREQLGVDAPPLDSL